LANEVYVNTSNSARLQEVNYSYSLPTTRSISKWRFSAIVSDLDLPSEIIWRTYRGCANCEHRIKALKYDFAANSLAMQDVCATKAAMNTVMLAYNLMGLPPSHQLRLLEVFMENLGSTHASPLAHEFRRIFTRRYLDLLPISQ
jgi:hypothetical protein